MNFNSRSLLRHLYLSSAGRFAKPAPGVHILNGHYLARENGDPAVFGRLLHRLRKECRLIRIEEAVRMITASDLPAQPCLAFTFDDGFEDQYSRIATVLEAFGINAAFFIIPGYMNGDEDYHHRIFEQAFRKDRFLKSPRQPMTWEQVKDLHRRGHVIGSHGMHHRPLTGLDPDALATELGGSAEAIRTATGIETDWFAFPFGRLTGITLPVIEQAHQHYRFLFSQDDHRHYYSFGGRVINRRHFEPCWPLSHIHYFIGKKKTLTNP